MLEETRGRSPSFIYGIYSMLWTVHSGNTANEDCLVLARVQMPPSTLSSMVVTTQLFLALRTAALCTSKVLDPHLNLFGWNVKFDVGDSPRGYPSWNVLIEFFVLHLWGSFHQQFYHHARKCRMDHKNDDCTDVQLEAKIDRGITFFRVHV